MNDNFIEELFEHHGIKPTANRQLVARALADSRRPLSLAELEERLVTLDRSSIFRVLTLFRDQHLVHVIEGGSEGVHYELCQSHSHETDDDQLFGLKRSYEAFVLLKNEAKTEMLMK